ncbi:hypothetical protein Tco_0027899 [Tanacetum coccineum]
MLSSKGFKEEGVFSWLDEVPLVDEVFDGAFGGVGDEEVVVGEGVVSHGRKRIKWNPWQKGLKKMKMIRRVVRSAYLIRKHKIEEEKHED